MKTLILQGAIRKVKDHKLIINPKPQFTFYCNTKVNSYGSIRKAILLSFFDRLSVPGKSLLPLLVHMKFETLDFQLLY